VKKTYIDEGSGILIPIYDKNEEREYFEAITRACEDKYLQLLDAIAFKRDKVNKSVI
jgi:hypothetical protein